MEECSRTAVTPAIAANTAPTCGIILTGSHLQTDVHYLNILKCLNRFSKQHGVTFLPFFTSAAKPEWHEIKVILNNLPNDMSKIKLAVHVFIVSTAVLVFAFNILAGRAYLCLTVLRYNVIGDPIHFMIIFHWPFRLSTAVRDHRVYCRK